jgi:hypothetical protein
LKHEKLTTRLKNKNGPIQELKTIKNAMDQSTDMTQKSRALSLKFLTPSMEKTVNVYGFKLVINQAI